MTGRTYCYLGFDFYGSGNVGDDLVLAGFLSEFPEALELQGGIHHLPSQQRRFPRVRWHATGALPKEHLIGEALAWLGVGDTPFQITSGLWLLNYMAENLPLAQSGGIPVALIGVGAETEALAARPVIGKILDQIDVIWTRDEMSSEVLRDLGANPARVRTGADLAHIALSRMPLESGERPYSLGIGYFSESAGDGEIAAIAQFIKVSSAASRSVCCVSNEYRTYFEPATYVRLMHKIGARKPRYRRWRPVTVNYAADVGVTVPLFVPEYLAGTPYDFVEPYARCEVVLSSRYHGVLASAWAGCRVGVLGGRSSKVDALAAQFGLPIVKPPYTVAALEALAQGAARVPRERLQIEAERAAASIRALVDWLRPMREAA
jgi:Polysaccharide pyruvyl transferase